MVTWCLTFALLWCTRVHKSCMMERKEVEVHKYQPPLRCLPETEAENASVKSNANGHGWLKLLIFRILVLCSGF